MSVFLICILLHIYRLLYLEMKWNVYRLLFFTILKYRLSTDVFFFVFISAQSSPLTHNLAGLFVVEFLIPVENPQKGKGGQQHQADAQEHVTRKRSKVHSLRGKKKDRMSINVCKKIFLSGVSFFPPQARHQAGSPHCGWHRNRATTYTAISHVPPSTCYKLYDWRT